MGIRSAPGIHVYMYAKNPSESFSDFYYVSSHSLLYSTAHRQTDLTHKLFSLFLAEIYLRNSNMDVYIFRLFKEGLGKSPGSVRY
jgi:hypothetical protein